MSPQLPSRPSTTRLKWRTTTSCDGETAQFFFYFQMMHVTLELSTTKNLIIYLVLDYFN